MVHANEAIIKSRPADPKAIIRRQLNTLRRARQPPVGVGAKLTGRACSELMRLGFRRNALRLLHRSQHSVEHISSHMLSLRTKIFAGDRAEGLDLEFSWLN
jgi:hypothetical protein